MVSVVTHSDYWKIYRDIYAFFELCISHRQDGYSDNAKIFRKSSLPQ